MTAGVRSVGLPDHLEDRLSRFTELVGTAIANTASRDQLARLADEQAALRRVATLVARGARPEEVFASVADEAASVLSVDFVNIGPLRLRRHDHARRQRTGAPPHRHPLARRGDELRPDRVQNGPSSSHRRLPPSHRPVCRGDTRGPHPLGGRDADRRRGPPVGLDGRRERPGAAPAAGRRGPPRLVHGARGHRDRERRGARRSGGVARTHRGGDR